MNVRFREKSLANKRLFCSGSVRANFYIYDFVIGSAVPRVPGACERHPQGEKIKNITAQGLELGLRAIFYFYFFWVRETGRNLRNLGNNNRNNIINHYKTRNQSRNRYSFALKVGRAHGY